ncbi:MAG: hypothetical protein AAF443_01540, partial [Chlamydiota bacterium]
EPKGNAPKLITPNHRPFLTLNRLRYMFEPHLLRTMSKKFYLLITCWLACFSALTAETPTTPLPQTPPPLSTVDAELEKAQKDFDEAKKMFNPWYAGPIITGGAHNVPPRHFNIQPYLFVTNTYGTFDRNRKSRSIPDILTVNPVFVYQMGWLSWLDFTAVISALYNSQSGMDNFDIGDTEFSWGIPLLEETPYKPAVRFVVSLLIPTGKYNRLDPDKNGIDATGSGAYSTRLSLNMSKIFWWISTHPFRTRLSLNYTIPMTTHVKNFNAYGGGFGTSGKVRPGNLIEIDGSIEWSFTQKWVLTLDLVYTYQNHATFSGNRGISPDGTTAAVGAPSSERFSAAPAIQYNPSQHLGILIGAWVALTGRNAGQFVSGIATVTYYW